jgi:hypothetical protein
VYHNNAICYYKVSGESPTPEYKVCFAVVDDISEYTDREFEDVYDNATEKWYKLNNLNQYEEYGIYGNGMNITYYKGKLTIDNGYEYEWNGSSWVNLGEVTGSTATLPNVPFTVNYNAKNYDANTKTLAKTSGQLADVDAVITAGTPTVHDGYLTIASNTRATISGYSTYFNRDSSNPNMTIVSKQRTDGNNGHMFANRDSNYNWMYRCYSNKLTLHGGSETGQIAVTTQPVIESVRVNSTSPMLTYNNYTDGTSSTTASFSYGSTNNGNVGLFAGYGTSGSEWFVGDFYWIYMSQTTLTDEQVQEVINYNEGESSSVYPKYYSEKADPLDNLTFNTMAEAQTYAYNNCVYDGMKAIIDGDRYYFDSEDENGWVKILEYYKVEDVTPNQDSGWTISGSDTYNPDSSYYDDFDLETTSTSYSHKIANITIYGYDNFTYYLRTSGYSNYCYVVATNVDEVSTPPSSMLYYSSSAITNTYSRNKSPKSAVNLSNYRRVTYNNLDKTVEHTFYVYFNGRTYSSYVGNATILIPKEQTNENWEQVTFSSSQNVSGANKTLYIDNNNSTSGGTSYWNYRWIVGLPSGSHSSYVSYSNYEYCPNTTSSTFTSVAGEQRQVNFTYDNTSTKTLVFRLTDGSNVLTPTNTVYYNMTWYNSCGVSSSESNVAFPLNKQVKVGGRFRFANSSNRHYIYGYSPNISLNTDYYVDNYQDTFDITYTKLSDEAVTITYTTYDPSDVETPTFKTDITYPYNGGTTSSTTLASYAVPYTYPYEVSQTNGKFSADGQSYTAGQAARTINFVLYPNNREFATVADMEAYQYAWEGMKATVGDTKYQYKNGEWVENQHSLPDVPFTVNYNAKQYNASTKTLLKTEGQLADVDAVITAGTPTVNDGYLTIASSTRATISGYQNYFNRSNYTPNLTIISKQRTDGSNCHMFANRDTSYNWMYRCYSNKLTLHGSGEQGFVAVTTQPVIESVRVNSSRLATYNNYTNNTSSTYSNFSYGGTNSGDFALFAGYAKSTGEWFAGDFYWVYMCQGTLTDEQVQQVIDYNENL